MHCLLVRALVDRGHKRGPQKQQAGAPTRPHSQPSAGGPSSGSIAPARAVAAHILLMVERGAAHSDDLLRTPRAEALTRQDRDLMTQLVLGTLRWERVLDREIAARLTKPDADMHFGVIVALRLGAYQLLFLDRIPAHAAIGESVELAKQADGQYAAGMVNAVLRRLAREKVAGIVTDRAPQAAHPDWMVARWQSRFGVNATQQLCAYDQSPPPTTLRLLDERAEASLASAGITLAPGEFLTAARRVTSGDVSGTAALASGWVRIQDEASQLIGELAAVTQATTPRVLDTCAAPGGKTTILLERLPGAHVSAMDLSETRLRMMRRRMPAEERLHTVVGDAAMLAPGLRRDPVRRTLQRHRHPRPQSRDTPSTAARLLCPPARTSIGDPLGCPQSTHPRRPPGLLHLLARAGRKRKCCRGSNKQSQRLHIAEHRRRTRNFSLFRCTKHARTRTLTQHRAQWLLPENNPRRARLRRLLRRNHHPPVSFIY